MVIVDTALKKREQDGDPIRVAIVGAGYMGRGLALQIVSVIPGMRLAAVSNRTLDTAERAYRQAGVEEVRRVETVAALEAAVTEGKPVVTDDEMLLCKAEGVDVVVEATGEVEFGARVATTAIEHGKHVVLMNAELDALVGPILKLHAERAGVVVTNVDGDQPGVIMNLFRWVKTIGYEPVLAGNIKGLQDRYRTPETQRAFAERNKQKPKMITSFADGTKLSMEMAVVANATGLRVGQRGMYGPACAHVREAPPLFPLEQLLNGGLVDYVLGAEPGPGVFVLGYNDNPIKTQYAQYLKMGDGPLYPFYVPYHLPHLETPITIARAALFKDATIAPLGAPVADVVTVAKRDLQAGDTLDGIGGFDCYGMVDNWEVFAQHDLLPMSASEGCQLKRDLPKDRALTYADVALPEGRLSDTLRAQQNEHFARVG